MVLDKRKVNSKGWLYLALLDILKEKKIEEITVSELANHASIGRATFYRLYNSIDDILIEEIKVQVEEFLKHINNVELYDIKNYLKVFLEYWDKHIEIIEILIETNKINLFYQVMNEMILKKDFQSYDVYFLIGGSVNTLLNWIAKGRKLTPDEVICQISTKIYF